MKKIFLLTAVLLGAATASQAGVSFNFGVGIPLGPPPVIYSAPPVYNCAPPPVVYAPAPVCAAPVVVPQPYCAPSASVYFGFGPRWYGHYGHYYGYGHYRGGWGHRGWHR